MTTLHFTVRGRGEFPQDMLRYDEAEFASDEDRFDALNIERTRHVRDVGLVCRGDGALHTKPTVALWESFGWKVVASDNGRDSGHASTRATSTEAACGKPTVQGTDRLQARLDEGCALLDEVRAAFTRDDDLPDNLLARIDAFMDEVAAEVDHHPCDDTRLLDHLEEHGTFRFYKVRPDAATKNGDRWFWQPERMPLRPALAEKRPFPTLRAALTAAVKAPVAIAAPKDQSGEHR